MNSGFEQPNLPLSIKFTAELIEMVRNLKAKTEHDVEHVMEEPNAEDIQYFIRTSGVKEFFRKCDGNFRLFLGLSVGRFCHYGPHAASQVACLQNMREAYEQCLQSHLSAQDIERDPIKMTWPADLIVADVNKALNRIAPVEIDLEQPFGQCIRLLKDPKLREFEEEFIRQGTEVEAFYRQLFSVPDQHQSDVEIEFKLADQSIHWGDFKKYLDDPVFIELVNYLEFSFKMCVLKLAEESDENLKLPREVENNHKKGLYRNWSEIVKVNDLAYVISEIVLLAHVIFKKMAFVQEEVRPMLLYPGPINMILGSGRNLLAEHYSKYISQYNAIYLHAERLRYDAEKQDKNADLFVGRLTSKCFRVSPSPEQMNNRICFIKTEIGAERTWKITVDAIKKRHKRKTKEAERKAKRVRDNFELSPYAKFIDNFPTKLCEYSPLINQMKGTKDLLWDSGHPIQAMINCLKNDAENVESPREALRRSLTRSSERVCCDIVDVLMENLEFLQTKFCKTTSDKDKIRYCKRAACFLVETGVRIQMSIGDLPLKLKKSRSILAEGIQQCQSSSFWTNVIIRPNRVERLIAGILFIIEQMTDRPVIRLSDLKDPEYYPDSTARVDYLSSQESQSGSYPSGSSL
jgi:hypothetical protein